MPAYAQLANCITSLRVVSTRLEDDPLFDSGVQRWATSFYAHQMDDGIRRGTTFSGGG